jgi:hypothetical protein
MDLRHRSGAAAEMFVAAKLTEQGYNVLWPLMTQSRYDLVAEDCEGRFLKIQVKKASWSKTGNYKYLQARITGKNKQTNTPYKASDIDEFAFTDMRRIWFAHFKEVGRLTSVCLDSTNPNYKPQTEYDASKWLAPDYQSIPVRGKKQGTSSMQQETEPIRKILTDDEMKEMWRRIDEKRDLLRRGNAS